MEKSLETLRAECMEAENKYQQEKHKVARLENRIRYLKKGECAKRTHRLITRGAAVESIVPQIKTLTEPDFYALAEKIFTMPDVQAAVNEAVHMEDS